MAAPTQYYVRPTNGNNGNAGTSHGAAWQTVQYALDNITPDATNGDQINLCSESANTLSATIAFTTYKAAQTPSYDLPLVIRGYTSSANDGGEGELNGNGSYEIFDDAAIDFVTLADLLFTNTGSNAYMVQLDNNSDIFRCRFTNGTATTRALSVGTNSSIIECEMNDVATGTVIHLDTGVCINNWLYSSSNAMLTGIRCSNDARIEGNFLTCATGTSQGIFLANSYVRVIGNTLYGGGTCTGDGIKFASGTYDKTIISNNLVVGFGGVGGSGINFNAVTSPQRLYAGNAFYNNTSNISNEGDANVLVIPDSPDNESLGSDPLAKSGSNTFANRFTYFGTNDVGNVRAGAYPFGCNRDKGAVQAAAAAGGGGASPVILSG